MKKSSRQKYLEQKKKQYKAICRSLGVERAIKRYGLREVTSAMAKFVNTQRDIARLARERAAIENRLAEIKKKTG